jgi:uncharacterized protein
VLYRVTVVKLLALCCLLLLNGCALQQMQINTLADDLPYRGAEEILLALEQIEPKPRDRAQYLLNRGRLKNITGDTAGSIRDLQEAKSIMTALQATSISENLTAVTINETRRSYTGTPSERVMLHLLLTYNYLAQGQLLSARVEMLQADVTMRELSKGDSLRGQLASAHFTSGLVYELNNEWDDAMISYRRAAEIMDKQRFALPPALEDSLLQTSFRQGLKKEYNGYVNRFSREAKPIEKGDTELIIVYADGNVSVMQQTFIRVFSRESDQLVTVAVPFYPPANHRPQPYTVNVAGQFHSTRILEDIEQLARDDLTAQIPRITATALARIALKYKAVENADKQGDFARVLVNVATAITETADVRSWNMLPANLQIARVRIAKGLSADITSLGRGLTENDVVSFNGGKKLLLLANGIN